MQKTLAGGVRVLAVLVLGSRVLATTPGAMDLSQRYAEAVTKITTESPASSNLVYHDFPPFGAEWDAMAAVSFEKNGPMLALMREIRMEGEAGKAQKFETLDLPLLNKVRELANVTGDAALWAQQQGHDAEALEFVRDARWLAKSLREARPTENAIVTLLVAEGIEALCMHRLSIIASGLKFTADDQGRAVETEQVHALIMNLLDQVKADKKMDALSEKLSDAGAASRMKETFNRVNAERTMAAMSLACHLYRNERGEWPANGKALLESGFLPKEMVDPWGDGKEAIGYALVKQALPDGSDRPLVYTRCNADDGLMYKVAQPEYGFYIGDGSSRPIKQQKRGGQFRDIAAWTPTGEAAFGPAMRKLE